jgi:hypothetical protein
MIRMPLLWEDGWLASWLAFVQSVVSCPFAVLIIAAFFFVGRLLPLLRPDGSLAFGFCSALQP